MCRPCKALCGVYPVDRGVTIASSSSLDEDMEEPFVGMSVSRIIKIYNGLNFIALCLYIEGAIVVGFSFTNIQNIAHISNTKNSENRRIFLSSELVVLAS